MKNNEFKDKLKQFQIDLENQYLEELKNTTLTSLTDYKDYSLLVFGSSSNFNENIKNIFIDRFSKWKVGDKFRKITTFYYKNSPERIEQSIDWEIKEIGLFYDKKREPNYFFVYYCIDANRHPMDQFPKKDSFRDLEDIDKQTYKVHYEKIN